MNAFNLDSKKFEPNKRQFNKRKVQLDKKSMMCEVCKKRGHGKDTLKLHGVPDWYKDIRYPRNQSCRLMLQEQVPENWCKRKYLLLTLISSPSLEMK